MSTALGALMRKIRKRAKRTQGQFAGALGVKQSAISMYENGALNPSDSVLMLLATMTETQEEKQIISAAMHGGEIEGEPRQKIPTAEEPGGLALLSLRDELRRLRNLYGGQTTNMAQLIQLTLQLVRDDAFVPDWLLELIVLWRRNRDIHEIWTLFENLPHIVKTEVCWVQAYGKDEPPDIRPAAPTEEQQIHLRSALSILQDPNTAPLLIKTIETLSQIGTLTSQSKREARG